MIVPYFFVVTVQWNDYAGSHMHTHADTFDVNLTDEVRPSDAYQHIKNFVTGKIGTDEFSVLHLQWWPNTPLRDMPAPVPGGQFL